MHPHPTNETLRQGVDMDLDSPRLKAVIAAIGCGILKISTVHTRTCRALAGAIWNDLTDKEKQEFGRAFYHSGAYTRLGLSVARRCGKGAAQTYRLAKALDVSQHPKAV
jgi:hypothetical protein